MTHPTKKRKATYLRRKEENDVLQAQVLKLQEQIAILQHKRNSKTNQKQELYKAVGLNMTLNYTLEQQQLNVASAQSMMSEWLRSQSSNPMGMRIHLGRDWTKRRKTLLKMKDERLARGFQYVTTRSHHLDSLKPHFAEERFEDDNGDFCCTRNEVIPFPGVQSMRSVFEALKFTMDTLEISISEQLGHITVRDDYDTVDDSTFISNYRLTSGIDSGVSTDLNAVAFGQYIENGNKFGGQPYAVIAIDSVDQDDLHPFNPQKCVRKTIHGTIVLVPVKRKIAASKQSSTADEVVIVMLRSFFVKTCRPQFDAPEVVLEELRDNVTRWGDVVVKAVRGMIYAQN